MTQPSPDERLRERLAHLPDACRRALGELDTRRIQGGGVVTIRLEVDGCGNIRRMVVEEREYSLRA